MKVGGRRTIRAIALGGALLAARIASAECSLAELCEAPTGTCEVRSTHELDDQCDLDFMGRNLLVVGTIESATPGGSFTLRPAGCTIDGGAVRSKGPSGFRGGDVSIFASGPFVMEPA